MADITELIFSKAAELVTIAGFEKITIGFAESLTGGLISSSVVAVPGASAVFKGSVVSYTNEVKEGVLGVPSGIISAYTTFRQWANNANNYGEWVNFYDESKIYPNPLSNRE